MSELHNLPSRLDPAGMSPLEQKIVDKTESAVEQVRAECNEYVEQNLDKTVEKPAAYAISQLKLNSKIPGTAQAPSQKSTQRMHESMLLVKDLSSEKARQLALAKGAQAMAKSLKEKTSFLKRKSGQQQQQQQQQAEEEMTEKGITEEEFTWDEMNRINKRSKNIYDTSNGMLGQIKEKQDKLLMWTWKKI